MSPVFVGAMIGAAASVGGLLVVGGVRRQRRGRLARRVLPYVPTLPRVAESDRTSYRFAPGTPLATLERLLGPSLHHAADVLERVLGGAASVRRRLDQARLPGTVQDFRIEQVSWAAVAFLGALALSVLALVNGVAQSPLPLFVLSVLAGVAGVLARDHQLTRQVRTRERQILAELPTVADVLALSVAAGEGPMAALERVARVGSGELSREIERALAEARTGQSLVAALGGIANRTGLAPLARFVDGIAIAVERGTPLAEVLRAQAEDVREAGRRALMEAGGRKEIAMMVPVVFLVLPVTVLFALFPGFVNLRLTVP